MQSKSSHDSACIWYTALAVFILDRVTKFLVLEHLQMYDSISLGIISITHIKNTGITWGLLATLPWIPFLASILVIAGIIYYAKSIPKNYYFITGLILGGATGNLLDRILYGAVIDWIDLGWWPVFNIADSAITIAGVFIIGKGLAKKNNSKK
ncbi:MAG: signal peptidase II [Nanoarchaeota archaeon]